MENAKVSSTDLFMSYGMATFGISLEFGRCSVQTFEDYTLNSYDMTKWLQGILNVFEVERWEDIEGKFCRVSLVGGDGRISQISHITDSDIWVNIDGDTPDGS